MIDAFIRLDRFRCAGAEHMDENTELHSGIDELAACQEVRTTNSTEQHGPQIN
jgi:hypothetical protein